MGSNEIKFVESVTAEMTVTDKDGNPVVNQPPGEDGECSDDGRACGCES